MAKTDWSPPIVRDDGVAMHGAYPLHHGMRAEALARHGAKHDPDGLITDGLIDAARHASPAAPRAKAEGAKGTRGRPAKAAPAAPPPQAHAGEPAAASPATGVTDNV